MKPDQVAGERVGEQLRLGRERLGLNVSAVADEQHLRPSVIEAIESGEYSKIDSELFLKGYVRAYARQVGLDADAVIADLDRELEPVRQQKELEHETNPLVFIERNKRRKQQLAKLLAVVIVISVAAYLIVAYLAERDASSDPVSAPGTENTSETLAPQENPASSSVRMEQGDELPEAPVQEPEQVPFDDAADPIVASADPVPTDAGPDGLPQAQIPPDTQITEPVLQEAAPPVANELTQGRLQMSFSDDCWIQVTDADGNRLASALRRSGDQLEVAGEAPLTVVIGAVSAVESIQFQGEALNISNLRVVNNRSEFTLEL
ncbi:MAG: DUF4115 domain-containing protein [Marinobacter sp.]